MSADDVLREFLATSADDLGRLLAVASDAVNAELMTRLGAAGYTSIRPSHVPVFAGLEPGGSQITELASRAAISRQAMSMLVREVESLGYVMLTPDPNDRRALRVELTDLGVEFCRAVIDISAKISSEFQQRWSPDGLALVRARLRDVPDGLSRN